MRRYSFLKIPLRKRHTHYSAVEHRAQKITLLPDGEKNQASVNTVAMATVARLQQVHQRLHLSLTHFGKVFDSSGELEGGSDKGFGTLHCNEHTNKGIKLFKATKEQKLTWTDELGLGKSLKVFQCCLTGKKGIRAGVSHFDSGNLEMHSVSLMTVWQLVVLFHRNRSLYKQPINSQHSWRHFRTDQLCWSSFLWSVPQELRRLVVRILCIIGFPGQVPASVCPNLPRPK